MVKLNEKKPRGGLIFPLCRGIKQGIDCDSVPPEGCVRAVWNPAANPASLSAVTVFAVEMILFHLFCFFSVSPLIYRGLRGQRGWR